MPRKPLLARLAALAVLAILTSPLHAATSPDPKTPAAPAAKPTGKAAAKPAMDKKADPREDLWSGLELRSIGPAITSGRIIDVAVDPSDSTHWVIATAAGGVWTTNNAGITFTPRFDDQGSFSIGCVTFAPSDPMIVWAGSGENNAQRVVAYGDGVYKSIDGGKTWKNMGLKDSQHIGKILVDPRDANIVWVAAQGPLWNGGGDRGLYKTIDGGKSWAKVLEISENTGVSDIAFDPRDPDVVYATAWQRRRHVWTMISGGPESAVYKTTDGGKSFRKIMTGLPKVELGRVALAVSPIDPNVVYAIVEAAQGKGGFFRSSDRGESWEKQSDYATSGNYYQELFADPQRFDRVYAVDVFLHVTDDGGASFRELGEPGKHTDNHVLWLDPKNRDHYIDGCDGGLYETYDGAKTWKFFANLPVTQFYKVATDDSLPFYRVYGGTQDNMSLGGPSRTKSSGGIVNSDWLAMTTGDGFQARAEPGHPNVVYAESQYGGLARVDLETQEETNIAPLPEPGEDPSRWNWDAPYIISPHAPTRLYFASQRVYRSDDRGDTWTPISADLSRQLDRDQLPVMGKIQRADAVGKNGSTSFYGNIVALAESRLVEGLLYVGTDDGLIQVSEDTGKSWRKIDSFPGVPERAYVRRAEPSRHSADVVYAAFDNHEMGDFKPYLLKSSDRGRTWSSIAATLPEHGTVYSFVEDPIDPKLLFVGTEFGLFCSQDGGASWFQLKGGLPTIQVRDLTIQERDDDLVLATFGRGFYILDDLAPLRFAIAHPLDAEATLFPVRPALAFVPMQPFGYPKTGFMGASFYSAENPPQGAVVTIDLKADLVGKQKARNKREEELEKAGKPVPYPTPAELEAEAREEAPAYFLVVKDGKGEVVRRVEVPTTKGIHRVAWDLTYPPADPVALHGPENPNVYTYFPQGAMAAPGTYAVTLEKRVEGHTTTVAGPEKLEVRAAAATLLTAPDRAALDQFLRDATALHRAALGASGLVGETLGRLALIKKAIDASRAADPKLADEARALQQRVQALQVELDGDRALARRNYPTAPALVDRSGYLVNAQWTSTSAPTASSRHQYDLASAELTKVLAELRPLVEKDLPALDSKLDAVGAPWTPGRVPVWPRR